jgi:hypothetical protein
VPNLAALKACCASSSVLASRSRRGARWGDEGVVSEVWPKVYAEQGADITVVP